MGVLDLQFYGAAVSAEDSELPIVVTPAQVTAATISSSSLVPVMVSNAGERAARRFIGFFAASIANDNTRLADYRAVCWFFDWLEQNSIGEILDIEAFHAVRQYERVPRALRRSISRSCLGCFQRRDGHEGIGGGPSVACFTASSSLSPRTHGLVNSVISR